MSFLRQIRAIRIRTIDMSHVMIVLLNFRATFQTIASFVSHAKASCDSYVCELLTMFTNLALFKRNIFVRKSTSAYEKYFQTLLDVKDSDIKKTTLEISYERHPQYMLFLVFQ